MFRIGNQYFFVNADELEETLFQHKAENEAYEKQVTQLRTTLENARKETVGLQQELSKAETTASLVPALEKQVQALESELFALQVKALSPTEKPAVNKGGRPRKTAMEGKTNGKL